MIRDLFKDKRLKKEKSESRELPKGRKSNGKGARGFVWLLLLFISVTGVLGFIRSGNALNKLEKASTQLKKGGNTTEDGIANQAYETTRVRIYASQVVDDYMNIPKEDDARDKYKRQLKAYFVSDDFLPQFDFDGFRELKGKTYYGNQRQGDHVIAQYKINYVTTTIEAKKVKKKVKKKTKTVTKEEEKPQEHEALINIPIRENKGGFAVVEPIYFSDVPDLKNKQQQAVVNPYKEDDQQEIDTDQRDELQQWVKDFFASYASKTKDDMAYMMDDPQALDSLQEFQGLDDFRVYQEKNRYIVKAAVTFQESGVNIRHREHYTMKIKQMNGKYYVEKLDQTIGGY